MNELISKNKILGVVLVQTLIVFLALAFLGGGVNTNGVWETVILNIVFFGFFPVLILKNSLQGKLSKPKIISKEVLFIGFYLLFFIVFAFYFEGFRFLKINYLSRIDWFLNDWWAILFIDLILLPLIIFSQELFFRGYLMNKLKSKEGLIFQSIAFTSFEVLFFEVYSWKFFLFTYVSSLFFGFLYLKTKSLWYSFLTRWIIIVLIDGYILFKIQNIKS